MKPLTLPLVEHLVNLYNNISLDNVRIIGVQHVLETTHAMFRSLFQLGLKPENISIIGKCYSTSLEVYNEMIEDGIDIDAGSIKYCSHTPFDELFQDEVKRFLSERLDDLSEEKYEQIIVLDDGGKCLHFLSENLAQKTPIIGIEQTTSGYEAIRNLSLSFPIINVARSPTKLSLESPMIAKAAAERLALGLKKRNLSPEKALILGGGAIGSAMYHRLNDKMDLTVFDTNKKASSNHSESLNELIQRSPLIIGCTGTTSIPFELHKHLQPNTTLVSVSSSDREFDSIHLRKKSPKNEICHQDLYYKDILLINSGFPVNFDGERENIEVDLIQLTIGLITGAILQARQIFCPLTPGIIPLDPTIEKITKDTFILMTEVHQEILN